jgi:adenylate cyclase
MEDSFFQTMKLTFELAGVTTLILLFIGIPLGYFLSQTKSKLKPVIETLVSMPLVLPPSVLGFYLLLAFSPKNSFGSWLEETFDLRLVFSFEGLIIASVIFSLPFMVHPIQSGFSSLSKSLKDVNNDSLKIQKKEITIFFSDIREFTKISEILDNPETLINYLNNYLTPMSEIVNKYDGTIDKYIGDCIMAYWNAPFDIKDNADKAVNSALEQLQKLQEINKDLIAKNLPVVNIGIGITTGIATIGEIGSVGRSDFTIIGDNVNIASRIESLCKYYGSSLIISEDTKNKLTGEYIFRYLDNIQVKGKDKSIKIWEVLNPSIYNEQFKQELEKYNQAIKLYYEQEFKEAIRLLEELETISNTKIYTLFKNRAIEFLNKNNLFSSVYIHKDK